jgi:hypothetical protein
MQTVNNRYRYKSDNSYLYETINPGIMKNTLILLVAFLVLISSGCAPFDKIYSHDFATGYFTMKSPGKLPSKVYLEYSGDSIIVYPLQGTKSKVPDIQAAHIQDLGSLAPGSYLYGSRFIKTSADFDLSTVVLKFRPQASDVQPQLSANVNGIFYLGFRKDFFKVTSHVTPSGRRNNFIRHTGFDFGPFAGIGITPVTPTFTMFNTQQEYDGMVFQKGFAIFGTFETMSVGLSVGFDNLLDKNRNIWVYNNKPWFGLIIGIANF